MIHIIPGPCRLQTHACPYRDIQSDRAMNASQGGSLDLAPLIIIYLSNPAHACDARGRNYYCQHAVTDHLKA
jgi:hypothetical protein